MLSPKLHAKIRELWNMFWSAGMTNPLVAIEQITYLLFLRQLENLDAQRVAAGKPSLYTTRPNSEGVQTDYSVCKWSNLRRNVSFDLLNGTVFPWLRSLQKWLESLQAAGPPKEGLPADTGDAEKDDIIGQLDDAHFALDRNKTTTLITAVELIDNLFAGLDADSPGADLMGDIFEDLLDEITSSGKNGQFRTPRHIIRFMVELVDPEPGQIILDPACGTGGFLFNTLLHWQRKYSAQEDLRLEWDGTPHRLNSVFPANLEQHLNDCFHGYDNDKSMVRVAWMNLVLHGLDSPHVRQLDSLSKRMPDNASGTYDYIFANPPFAGKIDKGDLSALSTRFPRGKGGAPVTSDTELLFVWLILDLLKPGGRAAVIVPDGVLSGSTNAHHNLRRDLLWEHTLEAVVSLPGGVFYPYAGVKTNILVFQKAGEEKKPGDDPRTREVWFYEVNEEARSLDQRRKERFTGPNDLWDALVKFRGGAPYGLPKIEPRDTSTQYFQPEYKKERWRQVDSDFLQLFPEKDTESGHVRSIHELFDRAPLKLPVDPEKADEATIARALPDFVSLLTGIAQDCVAAATLPTRAATKKKTGLALSFTPDRLAEITMTFAKEAQSTRGRLTRTSADWLDREFNQFGFNAVRKAFDEAVEQVKAGIEELAKTKPAKRKDPEADVVFKKLLPLFARLDGFEVWLRSLEIFERAQKNGAPVQQSWIVRVREWAQAGDWGAPPKGVERVSKPTHEGADPRPDYIAWLRDTLHIFDDDATVKKEFRGTRLDPACIEFVDLALSAGRHKPPETTSSSHRSPVELIIELQEIHTKISSRLTTLLAMVRSGDTGPGDQPPRRHRRKLEV